MDSEWIYLAAEWRYELRRFRSVELVFQFQSSLYFVNQECMVTADKIQED
ncbi:hypothetical protein PAXRUDRAFT_21942 [Paxillus rubicundulus Ve08.2h10]|uniref:Uncharacterized protein n=1 Tax=Paxillus rubicundulus Ve08.2h10 TaxID=930991 RepID=A0A0D0CNW5_9AGAM|nr:hypothetical protein PAXRUDRAFT_21942 [Paxillus rubicundulus Ve08.2h10]